MLCEVTAHDDDLEDMNALGYEYQWVFNGDQSGSSSEETAVLSGLSLSPNQEISCEITPLINENTVTNTVQTAPFVVSTTLVNRLPGTEVDGQELRPAIELCAGTGWGQGSISSVRFRVSFDSFNDVDLDNHSGNDEEVAQNSVYAWVDENGLAVGEEGAQNYTIDVVKGSSVKLSNSGCETSTWGSRLVKRFNQRL